MNWKMIFFAVALLLLSGCSSDFDIREFLPGYDQDQAALDKAEKAADRLPETSEEKPDIQAGLAAGRRIANECSQACTKYGEQVLAEFKEDNSAALWIGNALIASFWIILGVIVAAILIYVLWRPVAEAVARVFSR